MTCLKRPCRHSILVNILIIIADKIHCVNPSYNRTLFIHCPLVDVKKMPLGKLSKTQIAKGFEALEEIQAAVEGLYLNTPLPHLPKNLKTLPHSCTRLD